MHHGHQLWLARLRTDPQEPAVQADVVVRDSTPTHSRSLDMPGSRAEVTPGAIIPSPSGASPEETP
jgi:hypothetical protein